MTKISFILLISLFLSLPSLAAEKLLVTGEIFDLEGKEKKFLFERYQDVIGDKVLERALYKNLEGDILVEEKLESLKGELVRYDIDQKQLKQKAWVVTDAKTVTFNLKKEGKGNYPQTIKKKDNFIIGMQIVPYILKNWTALVSGEEFRIKLGVWDRQEAIRFDLQKDKSGQAGQIVVKMKPSSLFVRAIVSSIYFTFDEKTKKLIEYKGRTAPKENRDGDLKDFDGITRYKRVVKKK